MYLLLITYIWRLNNINSSFDNLKFKSLFTLLHIYCCSLYNILSELEVLLSSFKANLVALTETWLESEIAKIIILFLQGFNFEQNLEMP